MTETPTLTERVKCRFERERLLRPFGFKGGYLTHIWQVAVLLETGRGVHGLGLGTQNVLWCDPRVFAAPSEDRANAMMYEVTAHAWPTRGPAA